MCWHAVTNWMSKINFDNFMTFFCVKGLRSFDFDPWLLRFRSYWVCLEWNGSLNLELIDLIVPKWSTSLKSSKVCEYEEIYDSNKFLKHFFHSAIAMQSTQTTSFEFTQSALLTASLQNFLLILLKITTLFSIKIT